MTAATVLGGARLAVGAVLLARPRPVLRVLGGHPADRHGVLYARVLGARHLAEAAATLRSPTRAVVWTGAAVDGVHALSALWLVRRGDHRRLAALNTAGAVAFTAAGAVAARAT